MNPNASPKVCLVPRVSGVGGMVSFRHKLAAGLALRGVQVTDDLHVQDSDAVLVIGGTRDLAGLRQAKRRGIPVIQRLNGMNWLHRKRKTGLRHFLRAEAGNLLLNLIRTRLADGVVYQSRFARGWWERVHGPASVPARVIYNAVDLDTYTPEGDHSRPEDSIRVLLVEGSLQGGYELGLETALLLVRRLVEHHQLPVSLMVAGQVSPGLRSQWEASAGLPIQWAGLVARERIPELDRSAHLLYSADLNAACPNAVIEALACGLPVAAFDTGALPELVSPRAGRVIPYGGNPWQLDPPDIPALAEGAMQIIAAGEEMRREARAHARQVFGLDKMVAAYRDALLGESN